MKSDTQAIHFIGEINHQSVSDFMPLVIRHQKETSCGDITILFSSSGGVISSSLIFYDFLRTLSSRITMIATAQVSSAALYPFLAGDVRVALPTAEFFIHPISATLSGKYTAAQLRTEISDLEGDAERTRRIVTERTSITAARWNKMSAIDTTLAIPEALKCGILHGTAGYTKKTIKKP